MHGDSAFPFVRLEDTTEANCDDLTQTGPQGMACTGLLLRNLS